MDKQGTSCERSPRSEEGEAIIIHSLTHRIGVGIASYFKQTDMRVASCGNVLFIRGDLKAIHLCSPPPHHPSLASSPLFLYTNKPYLRIRIAYSTGAKASWSLPEPDLMVEPCSGQDNWTGHSTVEEVLCSALPWAAA